MTVAYLLIARYVLRAMWQCDNDNRK